MAITINFLTVVIRIETIEKKYPGGMDAFMKECLIWRDSNLTGIIFMSAGEAEGFIDKLINLGFSYVVNGEFDEIAIVDQFIGLYLPCSWLETSIIDISNRELKTSTCWLKGCRDEEIGIRLSRDYDSSLFIEHKKNINA